MPEEEVGMCAQSDSEKNDTEHTERKGWSIPVLVSIGRVERVEVAIYP